MLNRLELIENNGVVATTSFEVNEFEFADFYNERGMFLENNYKEVKDYKDRQIRLIYQKTYDEIKEKKCNEYDFFYELEVSSKIVKNKVVGSDFKSMLDDSNLTSNDFSDNGKNRRIEQASILLFDTKKLEIRIERQRDKYNKYDESRFENGKRSSIDSKAIWQPIGNVGGDEKVMVIGTMHTHPINFLGEEGIGTTKDYPDFHTNDRETAIDWMVPFFQLYPLGINQVDLIVPGKPNIDNISTTKDLLNDKFNLARKSLEINGDFKI